MKENIEKCLPEFLDEEEFRIMYVYGETDLYTDILLIFDKPLFIELYTLDITDQEESFKDFIVLMETFGNELILEIEQKKLEIDKAINNIFLIFATKFESYLLRITTPITGHKYPLQLTDRLTLFRCIGIVISLAMTPPTSLHTASTVFRNC
ncbi:MAG: hypothetical protein HC840_11810 [Leptolyngbyaceae cyanobacterium RM2_2_4]|nr:hypothetical protein [Leptolyngbyaceae cyanobacterium RM2_2_4]